jgi:hypothetical protein
VNCALQSAHTPFWAEIFLSISLRIFAFERISLIRKDAGDLELRQTPFAALVFPS